MLHFRKFACGILLVCLMVPLHAKADETPQDIPSVIREHVPQAQLVGQGTMSYMLWDVYDARLVAPNGSYSPDKAFALELSYKRHVDGSLIAETSASEIERQGFSDEARIQAWRDEMRKLFPDVEKDTTLSGIYHPDGRTCFFRGEASLGCITDKEFGVYFFNIWLGDKTSYPDLRKALLGQS